MMTLISPWADTLSLAGDLMHETGHMWFPMQVGSNETRYPWMDEGFTQFDAAQAMRMIYGEPRTGGRPNDSEQGQRELYLGAARAGNDMTLMWPGDLYPRELYFVMFYDKTAQVLAALRGVLGEETFHRAYREYGRRWVGKHPYPYDFFNTMSQTSRGRTCRGSGRRGSTSRGHSTRRSPRWKCAATRPRSRSRIAALRPCPSASR